MKKESLLERIGENAGKLEPPPNRVKIIHTDFAITKCDLVQQYGKTIDVDIELMCYIFGSQEYERVDAKEYFSIEDYWISMQPFLRNDEHDGLKAKAIFEVQTAVAMFDKTLTPSGLDTLERHFVMEDLDKLIEHYTGSEQPELKLLRTGVQKQLKRKYETLYAILFSDRDEIYKIDSHQCDGNFVKHIPYKTTLRDIAVKLEGKRSKGLGEYNR